MKIWKVILATMVIFLAGIGVGALLGRREEPAGVSTGRTGNSRNFNPAQARLQQLEHRMDRELGLTPEQHQRIDKIIAASLERTKELLKPVTLEVNHETLKVCDEIRDELTPEQKTRFDTIFKEHGERGERGGHRRSQGGPTNSLSIHTNEQP